MYQLSAESILSKFRLASFSYNVIYIFIHNCMIKTTAYIRSSPKNVICSVF